MKLLQFSSNLSTKLYIEKTQLLSCISLSNRVRTFTSDDRLKYAKLRVRLAFLAYEIAYLNLRLIQGYAGFALHLRLAGPVKATRTLTAISKLHERWPQEATSTKTTRSRAKPDGDETTYEFHSIKRLVLCSGSCFQHVTLYTSIRVHLGAEIDVLELTKWGWNRCHRLIRYMITEFLYLMVLELDLMRVGTLIIDKYIYTILCLSVSKWIYLNWGDEGLITLFSKVWRLLQPGGVFILEPQPWKSYISNRQVSESTAYLIEQPGIKSSENRRFFCQHRQTDREQQIGAKMAGWVSKMKRLELLVPTFISHWIRVAISSSFTQKPRTRYTEQNTDASETVVANNGPKDFVNQDWVAPFLTKIQINNVRSKITGLSEKKFKMGWTNKRVKGRMLRQDSRGVVIV
ncbi:hypothetical protein CTI12_AA492210 [Artemisia annua]|uniref:RNA methyltransferase n=1 Tax=Artemisia annua TaxID=35608 RepID=A0A2U1LH68_ARTAN|nr:hypothetical protein CTI12_AA492210 [Artemisia annua]